MLMLLLSAATLFSAISRRWRAISLMLLTLDFPQNLREFVGALFSLHFIVDNHYGCLTASSYTATFFQGNQSIGCGLAQLDVQLLFGFFDRLWDASQRASRSETKLNGVFAARLCFEKGIKRYNAMNLSKTQPR